MKKYIFDQLLEKRVQQEMAMNLRIIFIKVKLPVAHRFFHRPSGLICLSRAISSVTRQWLSWEPLRTIWQMTKGPALFIWTSVGYVSRVDKGALISSSHSRDQKELKEGERERGWGIAMVGKWEEEGCQGNWLLSDKLTIEKHSCYISLITPSLPSPIIWDQEPY